MNFSVVSRLGAIVLCGAMLAAASPASALDKPEIKCFAKLAQGAGKTAASVAKARSKCLGLELSGKFEGPCPDEKTTQSIEKARDALIATAEKSCFSTCALTGLDCIGASTCPVRPQSTFIENCTGGSTGNGFEASELGFPGAFCPSIIGGPLLDAEDIGRCSAELAVGIGDRIVEAVFGSVTAATGLSEEAVACVGQIAKSFGKFVDKSNKAVAKCRGGINKGKSDLDPADCPTLDEKTAATIAKGVAKLEKTLDTKCTDSAVAELDLCGAGIGGIVDREGASDCLAEAGLELVEPGALLVAERTHRSPSLVEVASPPAATCGDGVVNGLPNGFALIGEECDGDDDDACPGACFPPGDYFQCTCSTVKRTRFVANGFTADLDNGWTGSSHNSPVSDRSGFISTLSNCDCDGLDGMECVGSTGDAVCDRAGFQMPTCSWDLFGGTRCDDVGNDENDTDDDADCAICDSFAINAGDFCEDAGDCQPQCYDAEGSVVGACPAGQDDCPLGSRCRGGCDKTQTCVYIPLGAPLPISAAGVPTCLTTRYTIDVFGTTNLITGEQETFSRQRTLVHSGLTVSRPCPVCGGYCVGGRFNGDPCTGTCSVSGDRCRFDEDCPGSETCTGESPVDCPDGGVCELDLICLGGPNDGKACRLEGETASFGTTSSDCPPDPGANFSGDGLQIPFFPSTTEAVSLPSSIPCTATGYELFDCPCPDGGAIPSKPNACLAACDAGAEFGEGCANGNGSGQFTTCAGGVNGGRACDEDGDCPLSSCSKNPLHCIGDFTKFHLPCTSNADCGVGSCVDACPSGRCTPLCTPSPEDPQEGECIAGPRAFRCNGPLDSYRVCEPAAANGGCSATCAVSGNPCVGAADCDPGEACEGSCLLAKGCEAGNDGVLGNADDIPEAGICETSNRSCFLNPMEAEGGDTLNGNGGPNDANSVTVFCVAPTSSTNINSTVGLGGPARLRQRGTTATNGFTTLP